MVEPSVGGYPVLAESSLFPTEAAVVESADGKHVAAVQTPSRWRLLLGLGFSAVYDDNIYLENDDTDEDFIFTISPSIGFDVGDPKGNYLSLIYTPSFVFFADNSEENAVEHAVDLLFRRQTERWLLEANFGFRSLSGSSFGDEDDEDDRGELLGERVDRDTYVAGLRATYSVSDKTSVETGIAAAFTDYEEFLDTLDIVSRTFVDFRVTGKTRLGFGFGFGYAETEGGPEQVYEQALLRVEYNPTSKITLHADGGFEFRQVDGGDNQTNGIFGLGVVYTPFENTILSLNGYRRVRPSSAIENSNYTATGVTASLKQRFLQKYYVSVASGYEHTEYESLGDHEDRANSAGEYNYFFIRPAVEFRIRDRANIEFFYEYRNNESDFEEFEFANNRVGVKVGITF